MAVKSKQEAIFFNQKVYDGEFGDKYDKDISLKNYRKKLMKKDLDFIFKNLPAKNLKLLDMGCGTGYLCLNYYDYSSDSKVYCLDLSKNMLDLLKRKLSKDKKERTEFAAMDVFSYLKKIKFDFDLIGVSGALHHFFDYLEVIDMACKKIKRGGFFYLELEPIDTREQGIIKNNLMKIYRTFDFSFNICFKKTISPLKFFPYLFYAFSKSVPFVNQKTIEKLKKSFFKVESDNQEEFEKSETIREGLDLRKIREILKKNNLEIIILDGGANYSFPLTHKIINFFHINDHVRIIARRN